MAAEAVMKVRDAEEKGSEMLRKANDEAREIVKKAESDGEAKRKAIIGEAYSAREAMISSAEKAAEEQCSALILEKDAETARILNPDSSGFERAAELVIERIVNLSGHS